MSGFQEILVILLIVAVLFFLPRMTRPSSRSNSSPIYQPVSGKRRLAVFLSLAWPAGWAAFLRPWKTEPDLFLYIGVAPVLLAWGVTWVLAGFKNKKNG